MGARRPNRARRALARALRAALIILAAALTLTVAATVLTATGPAPRQRPAPQNAADAGEQVRAVLADYIAWRPLVPGVAVSVTAPGSGLSFRAAVGRRALLGRPADPGAPFRTASVTKTFTAAAVLRLVEQGRIGLDDTAATHLPEDIVRRTRLDPKATVRQLLNHTSGLGDYGDDPRWLLAVALSPRREWTPEELLDRATAREKPARAGSRWRYSDTGYVLLAMIIERATGSTLAEAYRDLLPMSELPGTFLEGREPAPTGGRLANPYVGPLPVGGHDPSYDTYGGGGLVSTVADLDAFMRALFEGGVFDDPQTLRVMLRTVDDTSGNAYGLGIGRRRIGGEDVWLHTGFLGAAAAYVPRLDASIAVTTHQAVASPEQLLTAIIEVVRDVPMTGCPPQQDPTIDHSGTQPVDQPPAVRMQLSSAVWSMCRHRRPRPTPSTDRVTGRQPAPVPHAFSDL